MFNLVPTEYWDYSLSDMIRGLVAAQSSRRSTADRYILMPGVGRCLPIRSARAAIVIALKALTLPPGASVGVPLYCCPVVFSAIKAAQCRPYFVDVDPDTFCISAADLAAKSSHLDAVIAVHMFGNICDVPTLRQVMPGKPIIEDCAQALGARLGDRTAGSFGEIAVFSFRSGKYISAGEGGAIHCRRPDLEAHVSTLVSQLPSLNRAEEYVHVFKTYFRSLLRSIPLWGLIGSRVWSAYGKSVRFTSQASIALTQIYETDRHTAIRRLPVLSSFIERQRSNADYYLRNSTVDGEMHCWEKTGTFLNRMQFPLLLSTSLECDQLAACLVKDQISTARPYKNIAEIAAKHYGYIGDCPSAERIAKTVLVIPCNYALKTREVMRISASVNRAWRAVADRTRVASMRSLGVSAINPPESDHLENMVEPQHFL